MKKKVKKEVKGKEVKKQVKKRLVVPSPKGCVDFDKINKINKVNRVLVILLIIIMSALLASTTYTLMQPQKVIIIETNTQPFYYYPQFVSLEDSTYVSMYLPAVDSNGKGIIATLGVEAAPGSGRVLVDIEDLVFWDDTQTSIRISKSVANQLTGKNVSEYDLVYNIHTNASMVGGPSAGAAIAIATIAAIENKSLNERIMITGSIDSEGKIGRVSSVGAKAEAAKQINVTTLLVPYGQSIEIVYEISKKCQNMGALEYCTIEQTPKPIDISEKVGIEIKEVKTVEEAMQYFFT